ncbi:MAG: hypothetical protein KC613_21270, partial [Myxococcales bacterium]|nr:hypothetical protein [Myxococcales bacterium]
DCDGEIDECPVCEGRPDGTVLDTSPWSECQGYTDVCDETGERTRTRQVCQGGQPRQVEDREACQGRDTDGAVQAVGGLSACAGFAGECGEQGTRTRTVSLCRNGQLRDEAEEQACERQTEGDVVDIGAWGACDYADPCDEQAQQRREQQICRGGVARFEEESRACNRDTDGQLVAQGAFGLCGGYSHDCDETGTRERTLDVCRNGRASREIAQEACRRNTDGAGCDFGDGQCQNERCVPICPDNDGDGHQDRACGGDDCDDNDRYKHPGRREVVDVRDNDCDGRSDEGTTVTMRRFHKHWGNNDSSHKFASFQPADYQPDGRWVEWFEVANDFCDTRHAPENDHPDNRCISQDGGAWVQLWGGYTLTAYAECEGVLGVNNVVLYLPETGLEYQDYRRNGPLLCRRVAYVYGGNSHRDAIDKEQFFRHRSRFGVGEMGTNMWSVDEDEVRAPWVTDPSFWTRGGGMDYPN